MLIEYTAVMVDSDSGKFRQAYTDMIPWIAQVAEEFKSREDDRTLVVVLLCPCCKTFKPLSAKSVMVSPFAWIDRKGLDIKLMEKYPPNSLESETKEEEVRSREDFQRLFRETINEALAS